MLDLTKVELAELAGVGLTVIRKIEQGNVNLNLAKVNQVLLMFGHVLQPVNLKEYDHFCLMKGKRSI